MAKLKIFKDNDKDNLNPIPSKEGYINVAQQVLANFDIFQNTSEVNRSDLLQTYANQDGGSHIIYQQTRNPTDNVPITHSNCKVVIRHDERVKPAQAISKHNMVFPEMQVGDPPITTGYLANYAKAVVELYGGGTAGEVSKACDFLFGIMLLTRCR